MLTAHFTVSDLLRTSEALVLYALVLFVPGYVMAWCLDLLSFRQRALLTRCAIAIPVSMGLCPVISYYLLRFSPSALPVFYAGCAVAFAGLLFRERPWRSSQTLGGRYGYLVIVALWAVGGLVVLVDLQMGNRLYFPTVTYDYALRSAVTASISRTGVPPANPYFFPGHSFTLRYHYFWFVLCSLMQRLAGSSVSARQAMIAGSVWCGFGLLAIVPLYLRFFVENEQEEDGPRNLRRRMLVGAALLMVTGLDIFPVLFLESQIGSQIASIEWWNDPVTAWVHAVLWVPHNIAGLIACLTGFLILWHAAKNAGRLWRVTTAAQVAAAGLMFASAFGMGIYIAVAFGFFMAAWIVTASLTRRTRHAVLGVSAGVASLLFASPYLLELFPPHSIGSSVARNTAISGTPVSATAPLAFAVKPFYLADTVFQIGSAGWRAHLAHLVLLPLNYLLEFGFFFVAGVLMIRKLWQSRRGLREDQLCLLVMVISIVALCSFVRSSIIANNDLGWRGMLIAQFVLLLWGVEIFSEAFVSKLGAFGAGPRFFLAVMLVAGFTGTLYEVFKIRFFPVISDSVPSTKLNNWLSKDRALGARTYELRALYEELRQKTSPAAVFQNNPNTNPQDLFHGMYADRQVAAETMSCAVVFGGDASLCRDRIDVIDSLFEKPGAVSVEQIDSLCDRLSIDVLIVKDTDRVWNDPQGWVWRREPMLANPRARAYGCGSGAARRMMFAAARRSSVTKSAGGEANSASAP